MFQSELVSAQEHYVVSIHPIFDVDNFAQHTDSKNYPIYMFWGVRGRDAKSDKHCKRACAIFSSPAVLIFGCVRAKFA